MLIRSLRLKNIKSYGEGAAGEGVTIQFQPGINRIAGKNGEGKSTLIESLGYALFFTNPVFEEYFNPTTYLLRSGEKAGEIDVTFEHDGQAHRLERGLGPESKRRSKVVLVRDNSIEAEGEAEVSLFLCRLLGFPTEARFVELFSKLIGVKQGRLTWPFDSKSSDARKHFEPLLDVEIFRQCFEKLKPAVERFEEAKNDEEKRMAAVRERIADRKASPEQVALRRQALEALERELAAALQAKRAADDARLEHETREKDFQNARSEFEQGRNVQTLARQKREHDEQRFNESKAAGELIASSRPAHDEYARAEFALARLHQDHAEKARLEQERALRVNQRTECEGKAGSARQQAHAFAGQRDAKLKAAEQFGRQLEQEQNTLTGSQAAFAGLADATAAGRKALELLNHWFEDVKNSVADNQERLARSLTHWAEVTRWDAAELASARAAAADSSRAVHTLTAELGAARQLKETLSRQLQEIAGGVCPFLKEQCRQFDPAKVQADISGQQQVIDALAAKLAAAQHTQQTGQDRLDKLGKEEVRLAQVRTTLAGEVGTLVTEHNNLFPAHAQQALSAVRDYHQAHLGGVTLQSLPPLAVAAPGRCFDPSGATLQVQVVQDLVAVEGLFHRQATELLPGLSRALAGKFAEVDRQRDARLAKERDLENLRQNLRTVQTETATLAADAEEQARQAGHWEVETSRAVAQVTELEGRLARFAGLETRVQEQQELKARNAPGHQRFLEATATAALLPERELVLKRSNESEALASRQLQERTEAWTRAQQAFDPTLLQAARRKCEETGVQAAASSLKLDSAGKALADEQKRLAEWETACRERERLQLELDRLQAAIGLAQKARQILQKTAPFVARHLCQRIALRAQQIYNQISPEPVELEWDSDRYSVRIRPGDRRFAMLSGGEQTKLALAMTLAMIQEFSGLKFCVFDEPTYGVDDESRPKLADAILEAHAAAGFDQLLLVSHDNAFEGKIENVVLLRRSASGSVVEGGARL